METIPIIKLNEFLLISIQVDLHDRLVVKLQNDLTKSIKKHEAKGVLIDISAVDMLDSFTGRMIANIASIGRLLDAETVVVGMQPAVAITLVELGMTLPEVLTALNVDRGIELLRKRVSTSEEDSNE
ncbi:STAS domain-containing protein [Clostridium sp. CX1]|uniref:STAS domain-containing protein n=1 Tax=Clostridium sp. CX1 TaxID=2978346 RepID=UPI0021C0D8BA|nr:STAS domain-containing protein [Clostridium sp. CX1]MCT8977390.1 STAS domain-containing protein [Clostridium sp. CX1]